MVIRQNATGVANSPQNTLYPADRCTWTHRYDAVTRQYDIDNGMFYPGNAAAISLENDITLGFIGKSGRFVGISEA